MENIRTIFTVEIVNAEHEELLFNKYNKKKGLVCEESYDYGEDDDQSSESSHGDHDTPAPDYSDPKSILRITTDHQPRNASRGFVFGRNGSLCDILLDHTNISEQQFAISPVWEHGTVLLKNYSRQGTIVDFHLLRVKKRMKGQHWILQQRESVTVRLADGSEILIRTYDQPANWYEYCARFQEKPPDLTALDLDPPETTNQTNKTEAYLRDCLLGGDERAQVFKVINTSTGHPFAMKLYEKSSRPKWEPQIMERLNNQFIVKYVSCTRLADERTQLIMEFINGPNLREVLETEQLTGEDARVILRQLLQAVSYLHGQGITHRDLKPENIFIHTRDPLHIKVGDFGECSGADVMETYHGTPLYTAPEIFYEDLRKEHDNKYTNKADIFSIGVIAYQLLYGHRLRTQFKRNLTGKLVETRSHLKFLGRYMYRHGTPPHLDFVSRLLQEDPQRRPSASESLGHGFFSVQLEEFPAPYFAMDISSPTDDSASELECETYDENLLDTDVEAESQDAKAAKAGVLPKASLTSRSTLSSKSSSARPVKRQKQKHRTPSESQSSIAIRRQVGSNTPSPPCIPLNDQPAARASHSLLPASESDLARIESAYNFIPLLDIEEQGSSLSHVSTREVLFDSGLWYVVIRRRRVSMDTDYKLNLNEILMASELEEKERKFYRDYYRRNGLATRRDRSAWLPFRHGYFLSQKLGLDDDLTTLFSHAKVPYPKSEENYLISQDLQQEGDMGTPGITNTPPPLQSFTEDPTSVVIESASDDSRFSLAALLGDDIGMDWMDIPGIINTPPPLQSFAEDPTPVVIPQPSEKHHPRDENNKEVPDGFYTIVYNQKPIPFNLQERTINATKLIVASGYTRQQLHNLLAKSPDIEKEVKVGHGKNILTGTWVALEDAISLCNLAGISLEPIEEIKAKYINYLPSSVKR